MVWTSEPGIFILWYELHFYVCRLWTTDLQIWSLCGGLWDIVYYECVWNQSWCHLQFSSFNINLVVSCKQWQADNLQIPLQNLWVAPDYLQNPFPDAVLPTLVSRLLQNLKINRVQSWLKMRLRALWPEERSGICRIVASHPWIARRQFLRSSLLAPKRWRCWTWAMWAAAVHLMISPPTRVVGTAHLVPRFPDRSACPSRNSRRSTRENFVRR